MLARSQRQRSENEEGTNIPINSSHARLSEARQNDRPGCPLHTVSMHVVVESRWRSEKPVQSMAFRSYPFSALCSQLLAQIFGIKAIMVKTGLGIVRKKGVLASPERRV